MMAKKVTKAEAAEVLTAVAEWLGRHGAGTREACGKCEACKAWEVLHVPGNRLAEKVDYCQTPKLGPAPTGHQAAMFGTGPELQMDFEFVGPDARPAVVLEGGPYDWAIECCADVQEKVGKALFVEPITGWALGVYRAS